MAQVTWNAIVEQLGRPDRRWPKHEGHLQYRDRFKLCAFLVANEVPQGLIRKLAHTNQITLRDKKARYEWDRLAVLLCNNEEKRGTQVTYGETIQLRHLKSRKYLVINPKRRSQSLGCYSVRLDEEGSEDAWQLTGR